MVLKTHVSPGGLRPFSSQPRPRDEGPWAQDPLALDVVGKKPVGIKKPLVRDVDAILPRFYPP